MPGMPIMLIHPRCVHSYNPGYYHHHWDWVCRLQISLLCLPVSLWPPLFMKVARMTFTKCKLDNILHVYNHSMAPHFFKWVGSWSSHFPYDTSFLPHKDISSHNSVPFHGVSPALSWTLLLSSLFFVLTYPQFLRKFTFWTLMLILILCCLSPAPNIPHEIDQSTQAFPFLFLTTL